MENKLITYIRELIDTEQNNIEKYTLEIFKIQQKIVQLEGEISIISKKNNDQYLFSPNISVDNKNISFEIADDINQLSEDIILYQNKIDESKNAIAEMKTILSDYKVFIRDNDIEKKYTNVCETLKIINEKAKLCSQIVNIDPVRTSVELKEIINLSSN